MMVGLGSTDWSNKLSDRKIRILLRHAQKEEQNFFNEDNKFNKLASLNMKGMFQILECVFKITKTRTPDTLTRTPVKI
jgi:hypothetical protein